MYSLPRYRQVYDEAASSSTDNAVQLTRLPQQGSMSYSSELSRSQEYLSFRSSVPLRKIVVDVDGAKVLFLSRFSIIRYLIVYLLFLSLSITILNIVKMQSILVIYYYYLYILIIIICIKKNNKTLINSL